MWKIKFLSYLIYIRHTTCLFLTLTSSADASAPSGGPSTPTTGLPLSLLLPALLYLWRSSFFPKAALLSYSLPRGLRVEQNIMIVLQNAFVLLLLLHHLVSPKTAITKSYIKSKHNTCFGDGAYLLCQRCSPAGNWWLCLHLHCSHGGLPYTHLESFQWPQSAVKVTA